MVIDTVWLDVAGGMATWIRSPAGSDADNNGDCSSIRCCVALATSLHSLRHQS